VTPPPQTLKFWFGSTFGNYAFKLFSAHDEFCKKSITNRIFSLTPKNLKAMYFTTLRENALFMSWV